MELITRKDYMDGKATFEEYYRQFVDDDIKRHVLKFVTIEELISSNDEHLNDIPLSKWDKMSGVLFYGSRHIYGPTVPASVAKRFRDIGEKGVSPSDMVCIYKNAARQIITENKLS